MRQIVAVPGPQLTPRQLEDLQAWAARQPEIIEIWVIGSRARGSARPDSDLDLTLELDPSNRYSGEDAVLIHNRAKWRAELTALLGLPVQDLQGENVPVDACYGEGRRTGISVYVRS